MQGFWLKRMVDRPILAPFFLPTEISLCQFFYPFHDIARFIADLSHQAFKLFTAKKVQVQPSLFCFGNKLRLLERFKSRKHSWRRLKSLRPAYSARSFRDFPECAWACAAQKYAHIGHTQNQR